MMDKHSRLVGKAALLFTIITLAGVIVAGGALADGNDSKTASPALAEMSDPGTNSLGIKNTNRTITDKKVPAGGTTTVIVEVKTDGTLGSSELFEIEEQFSASFGNVTVTEVDPGGSAGPGPNNKKLRSIWSVGNKTYTLKYNVTVPSSASDGDTFDITGTIKTGGNQTSLPSGTITVGGVKDTKTGIELRPASGGAQPNSQTTFDVVVTGANQGIGSYSVNVTTNDTSVATFSAVSLANAASTNNSAVASDGSWAKLDADLSTAHSASSEITIGTLTMSTNNKGTASLSINSGPAVGNSSGGSYTIDSISGSTLTVADSSLSINSVGIENEYAGKSRVSIPSGQASQGEMVNLTATVTNTGSAATTETVTLELGNGLAKKTVTVSNLAAGASTQVYVTVRLGTISEQSYTVTATTLSGSQSSSLTVYPLGDVDHSGSANSGDATKVQQVIVQIDPSGNYNPASADLTVDGTINSGDVTRIQKTIVGLFKPESDLNLDTKVTASGTR